MNKTLILPVAGQSSRFPGMRPKWLLTMPDGRLMVEKSVEGIEISKFNKILIVCLREHVEKYLDDESLKEIGKSFQHNHVEFCILDVATKSQSETVAKAIIKANISGAVFIKDCDNTFVYSWDGSNSIAVVDLNNVGLIDAKSKSYVVCDQLGKVVNIVEKRVISNHFCCGGYGFSDANEFLSVFNKINQDHEVYLSHVIYAMILSGTHFRCQPATNYRDWGTLREYYHYIGCNITLFCDVDGVLLKNGSKFGKTRWATPVIQENLVALANLKKQGLLYLIITSCRPESEIEYIKNSLEPHGLVPDRYIMGLPHTRRIIVNDFSATNPYPSAIAISLERDGMILSKMLDGIFKDFNQR